MEVEAGQSDEEGGAEWLLKHAVALNRRTAQLAVTMVTSYNLTLKRLLLCPVFSLANRRLTHTPQPPVYTHTKSVN